MAAIIAGGALCLLITQWKSATTVGLTCLLIVILPVVLFVLYWGIRYATSKWFRESFNTGLAKRLEWRRLAKAEEQERLRLEKLKPRYVNVEHEFSIQSPANFEVNYRLRLVVEAPTEAHFYSARLGEKEAQIALAEHYNHDAFHRFLRENSYRFHLGWSETATRDQAGQQFFASADAFIEREDGMFFRHVGSSELEEKLQKVVLTKDGLRITVSGIEQNLFPEKLIERNYAMLTEGQKEEIEHDRRYNEYDEMLAVAALKRRLEFQGAQYKRQHDGSQVSLQTERVGRDLRISWQFKPGAPSGCELLGFRKAGGGFYPDQWDEERNGELVIQDARTNETIDRLDEGKTYFYTFILKPWTNTEGASRYAVARFQVSISTREETEAIQATLRRIEKKVLDPDSERISRAMKEVRSYVKFDTALDTMLKTLEREIEQKGYSEADRDEKIARLRDVFASLREKYEQ